MNESHSLTFIVRRHVCVAQRKTINCRRKREGGILRARCRRGKIQAGPKKIEFALSRYGPWGSGDVRRHIPAKMPPLGLPAHFMTYALRTNFAPIHGTPRRLGPMEFTFTTGTAFAVAALVAIVAIYFLWVRKLGKKPESTEKVG
jgi:hypothetical protein